MDNRVDIQGVLDQMRALKNQVQSPVQDNNSSNQFANTVEQMRKQISSTNSDLALEQPHLESSVHGLEHVEKGSVPSFGSMFKSAVDTVNGNQNAANELATRYELGDPKVDLPEVMIALQKSSVSFQAMTQVRNKMIEAYKEIINMPL